MHNADSSFSSIDACCDVVLVGPDKIPVHRDDIELMDLLLRVNDCREVIELYTRRYDEAKAVREPRISLRSDVPCAGSRS